MRHYSLCLHDISENSCLSLESNHRPGQMLFTNELLRTAIVLELNFCYYTTTWARGKTGVRTGHGATWGSSSLMASKSYPYSHILKVNRPLRTYS